MSVNPVPNNNQWPLDEWQKAAELSDQKTIYASADGRITTTDKAGNADQDSQAISNFRDFLQKQGVAPVDVGKTLANVTKLTSKTVRKGLRQVDHQTLEFEMSKGYRVLTKKTLAKMAKFPENWHFRMQGNEIYSKAKDDWGYGIVSRRKDKKRKAVVEILTALHVHYGKTNLDVRKIAEETEDKSITAGELKRWLEALEFLGPASGATPPGDVHNQ